MQKFIASLCCFFLVILVSGQDYRFFVGTYTHLGAEGIYEYTLNANDLSYKRVGVTPAEQPSYLYWDKANNLLYAVGEQDEAKSCLYVFRYGDNGLNLLNAAKTQTSAPCHIEKAGKYLITSDYGSGTLSLFKTEADGKVQHYRTMAFTDTGADPNRQGSSHMHSSYLSPDGKYIFSINLGGDCMYQYAWYNDDTEWQLVQKYDLGAGSGPRHGVFSKDGKYFYIITEISGEVIVMRYADGKMQQQARYEADRHHAQGSSAIALSKNNKFLYISNRLKGDAVVGFSVKKATQLTKIGEWPTDPHPRAFALTHDGKYMLVASRDANTIEIFTVDKKTGKLSKTGKSIDCPAPVHIVMF